MTRAVTWKLEKVPQIRFVDRQQWEMVPAIARVPAKVRSGRSLGVSCYRTGRRIPTLPIEEHDQIDGDRFPFLTCVRLHDRISTDHFP